MSNQVLDLISSLSMKTVKNGATAAEEQAAVAMIRRLKEKHNIFEKQSTFSQKIKQHKEEDDSISKYMKYLKEDSVHLHILDLNWDKIAQEFLTISSYAYYISNTHQAWETRNRNALGLREENTPQMTSDDYNRICYKEFLKARSN